MKTEKINELIKALRCSASTPYGTVDCKGCAYRYLEEVNDKIACPPDVEVNGVKYWESCDCERMAMDAADILEKVLPAHEKQIPRKAIITGHNNAINTDVGRCPICNGVELRACDHKYCPDCGQKLVWRDEE